MPIAALALVVLVVLWAAGASPWVVFALLCWGGGALVMGPRRRRARPLGPEPRRVRQALPPVVEMGYGRLPLEYQQKVERIRAKVDWLLRYASRYPPGSQELYVIERTATDYLPNTLRTYLALPPGSAYQPVTADGRTALHVLWDQLDLLDRKMDEMAQHLHHSNVQDLLANGRFLEERFGAQGSELTRPRPSENVLPPERDPERGGV